MTNPRRLTDEEGKYLLSVARETIERRLLGSETKGHPSEKNPPPAVMEKGGTFVTLTTEGNLRGCIGHILPQEPVVEGIRTNAVNAAFGDPRFPPLSKNEWKKVKLEISVLTVPEAIAYSNAEDLLNKLRPEIDGVIIRKGYFQAVFLPQVWKQLPGKEAFLSHLCMKAGLDPDEWKRGDLEVSVFQVQAFEDK